MRSRIIRSRILVVLCTLLVVGFASAAHSVGYIAGHVDLQDVNAGFNPAMVGVQIQLRAPGETTPIETVNTLLDANGDYLIEAAPGTYDVAIKASSWLREIVPGVQVIEGTTATANVSLKNGDLDGDNEVTSTDLSVFLTNDIEVVEYVTLITPGEPAPVVVISAQASASEDYAAQEMATYLNTITGRYIDIVDDNNIPQDRVLIAIGRNSLTNSIDVSGLDCEQYITDFHQGVLAITAGSQPEAPGQPARDTGTLYGVYGFLEDLGVRWYRPESWGEHVPTMSEIILGTGRTVSPKPYFMMRSTMSSGMSYSREESAAATLRAKKWAVRNRVNGSFTNTASEVAMFGGLDTHGTGSHSYAYMIPASEYFASHPEYFALVNGERVTYDLSLGIPGFRGLSRTKSSQGPLQIRLYPASR